MQPDLDALRSVHVAEAADDVVNVDEAVSGIATGTRCARGPVLDLAVPYPRYEADFGRCEATVADFIDEGGIGEAGWGRLRAHLSPSRMPYSVTWWIALLMTCSITGHKTLGPSEARVRWRSADPSRDERSQRHR